MRTIIILFALLAFGCVTEKVIVKHRPCLSKTEYVRLDIQINKLKNSILKAKDLKERLAIIKRVRELEIYKSRMPICYDNGLHKGHK